MGHTRFKRWQRWGQEVGNENFWTSVDLINTVPQKEVTQQESKAQEAVDSPPFLPSRINRVWQQQLVIPIAHATLSFYHGVF